MDFIDELKQFSARVENLKDQIKTEEATKTSIIMPFFQLLGYDIFNPNEFVPEFTADTGIKKGEKVDYAIIIDGKPIILIEAKWCGENLQKHDSQLFRYFVTTPSKFAILTNGLLYKIYTDLDEPNKMDEQPFLEFNILDIKDSLVHEIKKFHKSNFDVDEIFNTASELKYANQIKQLMEQQLSTPTDGFVNFVLSDVYNGRKTQHVIDKFRDIVKKSMNQFINEVMNDRIKSALQTKHEGQAKPEQAKSGNDDENGINSDVKPELEDKEKSRISTTIDELEGLFIVRSLLRDVVPSNRVTHKDTESYFGVLLDNNTWKWICRLNLSGNQKSIIIPDENKKGIKHNIKSIDELYDFKVKLIEAVNRYL
ncbi:hypothetical protein DCCM_4588 [Desulfocucumis palustris]|uniref:Restriction endonuclease type I HsdR N-terminal domain-containing protein n=1 Tax=Desulfocucumis palustris TaxID=1898651 RepID=A0A2L2XGG9_9FIRM|nr:type I restriction endonuclease [Desulfocucumis palustris]GBF35459.1 hypothetical protein DCCM_4588 [Desulfocucumis palustris]